jgi:hypothetical protein
MTAEQSRDGLDSIRNTMTVHIRKLESLAGDLADERMHAPLSGFIRSARTLRDLLARVGAVADACLSGEGGTVIGSVAHAYTWAIDQLEFIAMVAAAHSDSRDMSTMRREIVIAHDAFRAMNAVLRGTWAFAGHCDTPSNSSGLV